MRFTNSPFETMMKQKPRPQAPTTLKPPRGSRCSGWGLPVLRVSLLAGHRLCVLLPGTFESPGWREVRQCPANLPGRRKRPSAPLW